MVRFALETPLVLFWLAFAAALAAVAFVPEPSRRRFAQGCSWIACLVAVLALGSVFLAVVRHVGIVWADEATTLSISAGTLHGLPLYPSIHSPVLYSLLYGPVTFFWYAPFLWPRMQSVPAVHVELLLMVVVALGAIFAAIQRSSSRWMAAGLLAATISALLVTPRGVFMVDADAPILLLTSIGLWLALKRRGAVGLVALAACCGLVLNCKVTLLPIGVLLLLIAGRHGGPKRAWLAAGLAAIFAFLPFALPSVSLRTYLQWVLLIGHQQFSRQLLLENVLFAAFLFSGFFAFSLPGRVPISVQRYGWLLTATFLLCVLVGIATGSKYGSGVWQLLPLLPFVAYATAACAARVPPSFRDKVIVAVAVASMLVTVRFAYRELVALKQPQRATLLAQKEAAEGELTAWEQANAPGSLAFASGAETTSLMEELRFLLPLSGEKEVIDAVSVAEVRKARGEMSQEVTERILSCRDRWLVPHGELPFSTRSYNEQAAAVPYIFPDAIRLEFPRTHSLLQEGKSFDVWGCPASHHAQ